ncbi:MAG: SulP family inorganic anion transporter [Thioalkalivibrio sp.]
MPAPWLKRLLPFLNWFPMDARAVRSDLIAGLSVAMVLIPQSMAYAALAGLPVVYGLYASAVPVIVATLWGSSRFLHTGPTAMLSLLSAAAVAPFAVLGSDRFIEISVMLALLVGLLRLGLGVFRMNVIMNFVSQPVIVGFTNAAALIIGLSLLNTFMNVPRTSSGNFLVDLWHVVEQIGQAHFLTLLIGLGALAILLLGRRISNRIPWVLVVVVLGTALSAAIGFERKTDAPLDRIDAPEVVQILEAWDRGNVRLNEISVQLTEVNAELDALRGQGGFDASLEARQLELQHNQGLLRKEINALRTESHTMRLAPVEATASDMDTRWRIAERGESYYRPASISQGQVSLSSGGQVVGEIPRGLPSFSVPHFDLDLVMALLPAALVMALIGFMEASSISRALAAQTRDKIDGNQELIGQGLANIAGSFFQSYTVSGSFSRSAVAFRSGAQSGLFAIVSALAAMLAMLFLTPYLYHLPQSVLAAIVMSAVFGLIDFRVLFKAWKVNRADAVAGLLTFAVTLYMAPDLAGGVIAGVLAATFLFLMGTVKPRSEMQGLRKTGVLAGAITHDLAPISDRFVVLRFDGSLVFMNVAHFEEAVLDALSRFPKAEALLVLGDSINRLDATGADKLRTLTEDLKKTGVKLMFSGLKRQVRRAFENAGLVEVLGEENLLNSKYQAVRALKERYAGQASEQTPRDADLPRNDET